jgi:hypothetical protein
LIAWYTFCALASVMRLRRCDTPAGSDINEVLYHLTRTTETEALRERIAAMAALLARDR